MMLNKLISGITIYKKYPQIWKNKHTYLRYKDIENIMIIFVTVCQDIWQTHESAKMWFFVLLMEVVLYKMSLKLW